LQTTPGGGRRQIAAVGQLRGGEAGVALQCIEHAEVTAIEFDG